MQNLAETLRIVEERTGGALKVTVYSSGQLMPSTEQTSAVRQGTIEMQQNGTFYTALEIPFAMLTDNPFVLTADQWAPLVLSGGELRPLMDEAFAEAGVTLLGYTHAGTFGLASYKPIVTTEDWKGVKARITAGNQNIARELGLSVYSMTGGEACDALRKKVIDAVDMVTPSFISRGYEEFTPYFSDWQLDIAACDISVNTEALNALPPSTRDVLVSTFQEREKSAWEAADTNEGLCALLMLRAGVTLLPVARAEREKVMAIGKNQFEDWCAEMGDRGARALAIVEKAKAG